MNWTRQKSYLTGMNGRTSTEHVRGINELSDTNGFQAPQNTNGGNYHDAHRGGMTGSMLLGQPNYRNPDNTLHNNIAENLLKEQTFDNKIFIDTSFKDYLRHPEPYAFIVKFNGTCPKIEDQSITIDCKSYSYPKYLSGDTYIVLPQAFKNIKYVNVDTLILPTHIEYESQDDGSYKKSGKSLGRMYKYLVLKINELENYRHFSNNRHLGKECFIMKVDEISGVNNEFWIPVHNNVSYFDSRLQNIDRLTVELCNDKGHRLCTKLDGNNFDFHAEYRKTIDEALELRAMNTPDAEEVIRDLVPKLESLEEIVHCIGPELHLTFNTLEPQIDTAPKFEI